MIVKPEAFGLTLSEIREVYEKFDEPLGFEGSAREELLRAVLKNGWIRVRFYPRFSYFSIELHSLTESAMEGISVWARSILSADRLYDVVKVCELGRKNLRHAFDLAELAAKAEGQGKIVSDIQTHEDRG